MSPRGGPATARAIVDEVFGRAATRELWTGNYDKALPLSVQDFELSAVLPAVFYMFRFSHRRGTGKFLEVFGSGGGSVRDRKRAATIERVAQTLANTENFEGFDGEPELAILGDLLLCFCLENRKHALGRHEPVQRVLPAHYMASWVDLPDRITNLRYVPEMIVAMLADQDRPYVEIHRPDERTWFAVGRGFEENVLLRAFHQGISWEHGVGSVSSRTSDHFDETATVGLDQLLMVRLAQQLGEAPGKLHGRDEQRITNQRPVAEKAARDFSEDVRRFVRAYAGVIPRHGFVEMLESCVAVGLTTIVTSVMELLFAWGETGSIRNKADQAPALLFVDCSNGVERRLRALAEQSMDDFLRRVERFPVIFMALRLLDYGARYDKKLRKRDLQTRPYATEWLNLLGDLLFRRREEAQDILRDFDRKAAELAEMLGEEYPECAEILRSEEAEPNPVWRLAESLTLLQGRHNTQEHLLSLVDSALVTARPNGLAARRPVVRKVAGGRATKRRELRSLVFTDSVLDYLVHLHVLRSGNRVGYRPLPLRNFIKILHDRYGLCVDTAPPGMTISNDLLQANRGVLERRLRDLGLLVGVNDAEAMKHLKSRFRPTHGNDHDVD